jgi:integrase
MSRKTDLHLQAGKARLPPAKGHAAAWISLDPEEVVMIANLPLPYRGAAKDRVFGIGGGRSGALYRRWRATCERAGIAYLSPHAAGRHGFGTEMIVRQGIDPVSAAKQGRWSSPAVMLKTYSHEEDSEAKVRDAFAAGRKRRA